jgi:L-alanine-DL-glutamate epimerase-like enolase superfamily enzyme
MCIEDTWGSDIATAAALHLGAATDPRARAQRLRPLGLCRAAAGPGCAVPQSGRIAPPEGPGLGITVDAEALGQPDLILD